MVSVMLGVMGSGKAKQLMGLMACPARPSSSLN